MRKTNVAQQMFPFAAPLVLARPKKTRPASSGRVKLSRALQAVEAGAGSSWLDSALRGVKRVATSKHEFTTDEVWTVLGMRVPDEPRAIGSVMRRAMSLGYCKPTDRTRVTANPRAHCRPMRIWVSLLSGRRGAEL